MESNGFFGSATAGREDRLAQIDRSAVRQPGQNQKDARAKGFDGVLTLGLFRRVFISYADHYAVLEPR